jgi:hypothetical protein
MVQNDLLLKDICNRLPYGVKVQLSHSSYSPSQIPLKLLSINTNGVAWVAGDKGYPFEVDWSNCKPYLFPMSSMTEEQNLEYLRTCMGGNSGVPTLASFNWLDAHHFDYRGLIPMGLAIDATGLGIY